MEEMVEVNEDEHVLNAKMYEDMIFRRKLMFASTILCWIGVVIFGAALWIPKWEILHFTNVDWEIVQVELGVWGEWRQTTNTSNPITQWIPHFPSPPSKILRLAGADLKHYYRAQAAIGVIALVLLIANNCLALYTFYHHRYTYKRLTCALYIVVAMCVIATVEVLSNSVEEWNTSVAMKSYVDENSWDYASVREAGYCKYLAYSVMAICIIAAITFAYGSHKQKGENAATAEFEFEDRPVHIGRL